MTVAVTGIGIVHPLAATVDELAGVEVGCVAGLRARLTDGTEVAAGTVEDLDTRARAVGCPRLGRLDRIARLFLLASHRAVESRGGLDGIPPDRRGILFGTGLGCLLSNEAYHRALALDGPSKVSPTTFAQTVSNAAAGEASIQFGVEGPNATLLSAGCAGADAIGEGAATIARGEARVVLAGGGDALAAPLLNALARLGVLPNANLVPAEGAAVLVLEPLFFADPARLHGAFDGYAAAFVPDPTDEEALAATLRGLRDRVGRVVGERVYAARGGLAEPSVERACARAFPDAPVEFVDRRIGETFGASGAFAAAVALADARREGGRARVLIASFSYTGNVSLLAFRGPR